jgi:hypothetical protein
MEVSETLRLYGGRYSKDETSREVIVCVSKVEPSHLLNHKIVCSLRRVDKSQQHRQPCRCLSSQHKHSVRTTTSSREGRSMHAATEVCVSDKVEEFRVFR